MGILVPEEKQFIVCLSVPFGTFFFFFSLTGESLKFISPISHCLHLELSPPRDTEGMLSSALGGDWKAAPW